MKADKYSRGLRSAHHLLRLIAKATGPGTESSSLESKILEYRTITCNLVSLRACGSLSNSGFHGRKRQRVSINVVLLTNGRSAPSVRGPTKVMVTPSRIRLVYPATCTRTTRIMEAAKSLGWPSTPKPVNLGMRRIPALCNVPDAEGECRH